MTDELNGRSQASFEVPKPPGYIWGQKSNFAYIVEPCAVLLLHCLLFWKFFRYEGLVTHAYGELKYKHGLMSKTQKLGEIEKCEISCF